MKESIIQLHRDESMAGHSQFKNIMHRKGAQDAKRARMFARISREITVSVKSGSLDPTANPRLRAAIASARQANMPKDKIEAAIKKATGSGDTDNYEEVRYEGYGPGGVAVIVEVLTDNRNRTASEIRSAFSKHGGNLGETGSVSFMFDRIGMVKLPKATHSFDAVFEGAAELGAENVEEQEDGFEITCSVDDFSAVRDGIQDKFGDTSEAKVIWRPLNTIECGEQQAATLVKLMDVLDDNDDVQNVYANFEISDEVMEKIMG